ncbi:unnamed protein product, partial [Polarella glacialis]
VGLFFAVHLLACGWYVCAGLHEDPEETWLGRRMISSHEGGGESLLDNGSSDPGLQWLHAMYFIMTVFTTIGFGDIYAVTSGEICYVSFAFIVGAIVHSIILGEVISTVTRVDEKGQFSYEQRVLVEKWSSHTELGDEVSSDLQSWTQNQADRWSNQRYDKEGMRHLINGRFLGRSLIASLPEHLYGGELLQNSFFSHLPPRIQETPARLPLLLALSSYRHIFAKKDIVYQRHDFANHVFLVVSGTFAHIGVPRSTGGLDYKFGESSNLRGFQDSVDELSGMSPYQLFSQGAFFGDYSLFQDVPRKASVRCEYHGSCIVVLKNDMMRLVD